MVNFLQSKEDTHDVNDGFGKTSSGYFEVFRRRIYLFAFTLSLLSRKPDWKFVRGGVGVLPCMYSGVSLAVRCCGRSDAVLNSLYATPLRLVRAATGVDQAFLRFS